MFQFILGFVSGIYVSQNYNIPDIQILVERLKDYLDKYKKD